MQPSALGVKQAGSYDYNLQAPGGATGSGPVAAPASPLVQGTNTGYGVQGLTDTANTSITPTVDPVAAAAAAKAAEDAAKAASLRTDITNAVNSFRSILESRYGQVDKSAGEQVGKLNERFTNESGDLTRQIGDQTNQAGGAFAARGTRDSSDYGNSVDNITRDGQSQIRDLGTGLQEDVSKVGGWVASQKAGFDAQKSGMDNIVRHLAEETDPNNLVTLRNQLDARIAELQAGNANYNTAAENASALQSVAPSSARAVQLQTTLSQIINGNAAPAQKSALAQTLIQGAALDPNEQQKLIQAFQADLSSKQQPTA